jgi:hypothetical protein
MANVLLSTPRLGFVVATRAALAFGAGLLLSKRLGSRRRPLGQGLVALGVLSTVPALMFVREGRRHRRARR